MSQELERAMVKAQHDVLLQVRRSLAAVTPHSQVAEDL